MNMILTPDGKYAITSDMGFHQLLTVLDTSTGKQLSSLEFGSPSARTNPGLYFGLAVAPNADGSYTLYASQGNNHTIGVLKISASGQLTPPAQSRCRPATSRQASRSTAAATCMSPSTRRTPAAIRRCHHARQPGHL